MKPVESLTDLQRELLDLFVHEVPEKDLRAIKQMLAQYFAEQATEAMDRFVEDRDLTPDVLERWNHEHGQLA